MCTRIKPGHAAPHQFGVQLAAGQVGTINIGDFQFAVRRGNDAGGNVAHLAGIEIQAGDGVV